MYTATISLLQTLIFGLTHNFVLFVSTDTSPKLDLSIEGMRSQQFSVGVFFFLLLGIAVFSAIVWGVLFGKHAPKSMRMGERVMFGAIILGIIVAIIFGALQMVVGYLF
jgi:hypothetical protein